MNQNDFSRSRKQSFPTTLVFLINLVNKSLSLEIENFVSYFKKDCGFFNFKSFTKSAFVQYRKKINPDVFKRLSSIIVDEFYTDNDIAIKLWNGFRVLAVDGSRITLPNTTELKKIYGETKNQTQTGIVQARVSVLYDVLNNYVLDGLLSPLAIGEGKLALQHLTFSKAKDLIIYDRGYPSYNLIYEHCKKNIDYLIRVKVNFSGITKAFIASGKTSQTIEIYPGKNVDISNKEYDRKSSIKVRLIRVELADGEVELLMTSLLDSKKYNRKIFKELYYKRWGVETFYDELKNKLKAEHFSGYSNQNILQDFNAALFVSNVQTLIVSELEDDIDQISQTRKYQYKVNTSLSYGFLKNRIVQLFFSSTEMDDIIQELKSLFKQHLVPIRPNRSYPRNVGKYRTRTRPIVTKNQKDAI